MKLAIAFALFWAYAYVTWLFFAAIMGMRSAYQANQFPKYSLTYWLCIPWLIVGLLLDVGLNLIMSPVLLDIPQEPLFTGKCERLIATGAPWKANFCLWVCRYWLDPLQSGGHCKKYKP